MIWKSLEKNTCLYNDASVRLDQHAVRGIYINIKMYRLHLLSICPSV